MRFEFRVLLVGMLAASCTLTREAVDGCQQASDCREAFGALSVCGSDGFCEAAPETPRCALRFPAAPAPDTVFFGTIVDGSLATHEARARSVELAVRDANEAGGVEGRPLGLFVCTNEVDVALDELNQNEASVQSADFLASVGVAALIGPPSSAATAAVFSESDDSLLIISPSASSVDLSALEPAPSDATPGRLWRTTAQDDTQAVRIAEDLMARSVESVAIVHASDAYGRGIATGVQALFDDVELFAYDSAARLSELIAEVGRRDEPEVMLVSSSTDEIVGFLRGAADSPRYDGKTFFLTDAAANRDLVEGVGGEASLFARIRGSRPRVPDAATRDAFLARYQLTFGTNIRDFSFTTNAYDAAWLSIYGVVWAVLQEDGISARNVARGLRRVSSGPSAPINTSGFSQVVEAFRAGESVDVVGTSGALDFNAEEEIAGSFEIWGLDNTGLILIE